MPIFLTVVLAICASVVATMPAERCFTMHSRSTRFQFANGFGGGLLTRLRSRLRTTKSHSAKRAATIDLLTALASELRAGQSARTALERAAKATKIEICANAVGAARLGGDVPAGLRKDERQHSLPALASLAAVWTVAEASGAGLASAVDRLATSETANESVRRELTTQLAGPKATMRVLAGLPLLGLMLGNSLGASPIAWLTQTPWGLVVLVVGLALEGVGLLWTSKMMRSVHAQLG